jgi:hypothetical protein
LFSPTKLIDRIQSSLAGFFLEPAFSDQVDKIGAARIGQARPLAATVRLGAGETGGRCCRVVPGLMRSGSKSSMRRMADQVPLNIECVVDRRMNRNEALSRFGRFEALRLSFSSSNWLMRVLRTVIGTQSLLMPS